MIKPRYRSKIGLKMELLQFIRNNDDNDYQPDWGVTLSIASDFISEKFNYFSIDYWSDDDGYNSKILTYFVVRIPTPDTISKNYLIALSYEDQDTFSSLDEATEWIWQQSEMAREEKEKFNKTIKKQYLLP